MLNYIRNRFSTNEESGKTLKPQRPSIENLPSPTSILERAGVKLPSPPLPSAIEILYRQHQSPSIETPIQHWLKTNFPLTTQWVEDTRGAGTVVTTRAGDKLDSFVQNLPGFIGNPFDRLQSILTVAAVVVGGAALIYFTAIIRSSLR